MEGKWHERGWGWERNSVDGGMKFGNVTTPRIT